jgi:hypothetical protein
VEVGGVKGEVGGVESLELLKPLFGGVDEPELEGVPVVAATI